MSDNWFEELFINEAKAALLNRDGGSSGSSEDRLSKYFKDELTEYDDDEMVSIPTNAFYGKKSLQKVSFSNATNVGNAAFYNCSLLSEVDMPKIATLGSSAFYGSGIEILNLPYLTTAYDQVVGYCKSLREVSLPAFAIPSGSSMFRYCSALEIVDLPSLTRMESSFFEDCTSLKYLDLPSLNIMAGSYTFRNCTNLAALVLRNTSTVCILSKVNSFTDTPIASGTGYIYVPDELVDSYKAATNWATYADQIKPLSEYVEE